MATTTRMEPSPCLGCGAMHDSATSAYGDAVPEDGSISLCFECGHIMVFDGGRLRNPNDQEMHDIAGDPDIIKAQRARAIVQWTRQQQAEHGRGSRVPNVADIGKDKP